MDHLGKKKVYFQHSTQIRARPGVNFVNSKHWRLSDKVSNFLKKFWHLKRLKVAFIMSKLVLKLQIWHFKCQMFDAKKWHFKHKKRRWCFMKWTLGHIRHFISYKWNDCSTANKATSEVGTRLTDTQNLGSFEYQTFLCLVSKWHLNTRRQYSQVFILSK